MHASFRDGKFQILEIWILSDLRIGLSFYFWGWSWMIEKVSILIWTFLSVIRLLIYVWSRSLVRIIETAFISRKPQRSYQLRNGRSDFHTSLSWKSFEIREPWPFFANHFRILDCDFTPFQFSIWKERILSSARNEAIPVSPHTFLDPNLLLLNELSFYFEIRQR